MKYKFNIIIATCFFLLLSSVTAPGEWIKKKAKLYNLNYTASDRSSIKEYDKLIATGIHNASIFFDTAYSYKFEVYIHPDRWSFDSSWQKDWNMPQFKSECWMVGSGV